MPNPRLFVPLFQITAAVCFRLCRLNEKFEYDCSGATAKTRDRFLWQSRECQQAIAFVFPRRLLKYWSAVGGTRLSHKSGISRKSGSAKCWNGALSGGSLGNLQKIS